jgi:hypothetical protein
MASRPYRFASLRSALRIALAAVACLCLSAATAWAQGNETTSSSNVPGSPKRSVLVGAGTSDETTTGASGPQKVDTATAAAAGRMQQAATPAPSPPGPNGLLCDAIGDPTARDRCQSKPSQ